MNRQANALLMKSFQSPALENRGGIALEYQAGSYEVAVIGAGHAGCEAALALSLIHI